MRFFPRDENNYTSVFPPVLLNAQNKAIKLVMVRMEQHDAGQRVLIKTLFEEGLEEK